MSVTEGNAVAQLVGKMFEKLEKAGKLIWKPTDNQTIVEHIAPQLEKMGNFVNWARGKEDGGNVPETWKGLMLVNTKGKKGEAHATQVRAIAFPGMDEVFADLTMRGTLYDKYLSMLSRKASDPEAEEAMFSTLNGPWADEGNSAYTFQAPAWIALLCQRSDDPDKLAKALNTKTFRLALESAEYAKSHFPGISAWDKIINSMSMKAAQSGFSTAIFEHWKATRDIVADTRKIGVNLDDTTETLLAALGPTKQAA